MIVPPDSSLTLRSRRDRATGTFLLRVSRNYAGPARLAPAWDPEDLGARIVAGFVTVWTAAPAPVLAQYRPRLDGLVSRKRCSLTGPAVVE
jgi:hypothetical protein